MSRVGCREGELIHAWPVEGPILVMKNARASLDNSTIVRVMMLLRRVLIMLLRAHNEAIQAVTVSGEQFVLTH